VKAAEYERMFESEERLWWYVGMRAISFALLDAAGLEEAASAGRRLLDSGCGTGAMLRHLGDRGLGFGIDVAAEALRFCRSRGAQAAQARPAPVACARLAALPFPARCFDVVTCFDVIYHRWVEDDRAAVRELARVLRPGGVLLLRAPALRWLYGAHDEAVFTRHRYTRGELQGLISDAGLEPLRATYANTLLLPLLLVRRTLDRVLGRSGSDVGFLPAPIEWLFRALLLSEAWWIRRLSLPIGASVFVLARKPGAP
jgi:SAM-dependent methyltransferase